MKFFIFTCTTSLKCMYRCLYLLRCPPKSPILLFTATLRNTQCLSLNYFFAIIFLSNDERNIIMNKLITAISVNPDIGNETFEIPLPTQCPVCSIAYSNEPLTSYHVESENFYGNNETSVYAVYFCPHCNNLFLVHYHISNRTYSYERYRSGYIAYTYPASTAETLFTDRIKALSPKFVEIYHQSEKAENGGLTELCGMDTANPLSFSLRIMLLLFIQTKKPT